ncbi:hypothetical protein [Labilibaculum euxinus]|uniref:DUF4374 domain-containing protein n=1 Tax=Labilibaculum euxinus TaxID=2686357 RepID=A0A7M4D5L6_9BACT|nr:hypothetical protein [Labilibaculum euxinus]MUP37945.1 hypothetical protein [Labilibaculum euxinus]MVB07150.1 hypothetical protein [Labilibaculum euxinus]
MKKISSKIMILLMGIIAISTITSCEKDETSSSDEQNAKFLILTTVKNADGMSGSSYMKLVPDFSGNIDNSNAVQVTFGSGLGIRGKDIFEFPSFGKDGDYNFQKYTYNGTTNLGVPTKLPLPPNSGASNITKINDEKMYVPSYGIGKVLIINPKTMEKTGEIDLSKYAHGDNNPDPANGIIRDDLYYLCLDQVGADYMPYADYHQVDVAVIDPKTDKVIKVISEKSTNLSFPTRPMDYVKGMIFTDEQNDMYIACVGKFGYDPTYPNNGFVCIPSGKTEFDSSKSWDISNTTIEGTAYKPASIFNCRYIGNDRLAAYVGIFELLDMDNPYTTRNTMAVLIDLNAKTIKQIKGIPLTDGHSVCISLYNDLVIIGAYGSDKVGFFSYNPTTDEVIHRVSATGNPTSFHYFK